AGGGRRPAGDCDRGAGEHGGVGARGVGRRVRPEGDAAGGCGGRGGGTGDGGRVGDGAAQDSRGGGRGGEGGHGLVHHRRLVGRATVAGVRRVVGVAAVRRPPPVDAGQGRRVVARA